MSSESAFALGPMQPKLTSSKTLRAVAWLRSDKINFEWLAYIQQVT